MTDTSTKDQATDVAASAAEQGQAVVQDAAAQAKDVAAHAKEQAATLAAEGRMHATNVLASAGDDVRAQAEQRLGAAVGSARSFAEELRALGEGRTDGAPRLQGMATDLGARLDRLADRAEDLGVRGIGEEVADYARRRPGTFLLGSLAAGLLVGRLARTAKDPGTSSTPPTAGPSGGGASPGLGAAPQGGLAPGPTSTASVAGAPTDPVVMAGPVDDGWAQALEQAGAVPGPETGA